MKILTLGLDLCFEDSGSVGAPVMRRSPTPPAQGHHCGVVPVTADVVETRGERHDKANRYPADRLGEKLRVYNGANLDSTSRGLSALLKALKPTEPLRSRDPWRFRNSNNPFQNSNLL